GRVGSCQQRWALACERGIPKQEAPRIAAADGRKRGCGSRRARGNGQGTSGTGGSTNSDGRRGRGGGQEIIQVVHPGRAEPGGQVVPRGCGVAGGPGRYVVEAQEVSDRVGGEAVQGVVNLRRVQGAAVQLICQRDDARPQWAANAGATGRVPA